MSSKPTFHISCCGRSGSNYVYEALKQMGFSCLHEINETWPFPGDLGIKYIARNPEMFAAYDGLIGWKWAVLAPQLAAGMDLQFHLVRHPLAAIESATTHRDSLFTNIEKYIGRPDYIDRITDEQMQLLARAVNYWISYNQQIGQGKILLKVEEFKPNAPAMEAFLNKMAVPAVASDLARHIPKNVNQRKTSARRVPITLDVLSDLLPGPVLQQMQDLAESYGYDGVR
ncbi:MAG: hypothetical protein AAF408_06380 [Pseudomonadota bacterium]